jgi:daunorubicin resistance ABC transporter ATP-binding subunit
MAATSAIIAEGLIKRFGPVPALDGVDLEVTTGRVLGLLGPNGAGKTTAVRILTTLLVPDAGRAWVAGHDVVREAGAVRRVIGLSGQYAAVDAHLTGRENLHMIGRLARLGHRAARRRAEELLARFDLTDAAGRTARTYSGGMRRRLDVAASLVATPQVLFLDEPTTGLDPHGRTTLWELLTDLTAQGTTLVLTTQYLEEADRLADTIAVIDHGRVLAHGTPDQLKAQVGGDRLELQAAPGHDPGTLAAALTGLGSRPPVINTQTGRVVLPVTDGPAVLPDVLSRLATTGVRISDLALRRPTLDDVFNTLTSHATTTPNSTELPTGRDHNPTARGRAS